MILVTPGGGKTWVYRTRMERKLTQAVIGHYPTMSLAEALKKYASMRAIRASGKSPIKETRNAKGVLRVKGLCTQYIEMHAKPNKRSWESDRRMLAKHIIPVWGDDEAHTKTRADVVHLIDKIIKKGHLAQARKLISLISKVWNFGIDRGEQLVNPAYRMKKPAINQRTRHLKDGEIVALFGEFGDRLPTFLRTVLKLQLLTGLRINEAISIQPNQVDIANKVLWIPADVVKNKRDHCIPLCNTAITLIEPLMHFGKFLFPSVVKNKHISPSHVAHTLDQSIKSGRIAKFTTHDLRRTVETRLSMLNVSQEIRNRILNHVDSSVGAKHYNQYDFMDEKRRAIELLESHINRMINQQGSGLA